jgi:hypothetical protein
MRPARGAVELVRGHSRLSRKGKTVVAKLALRFDDSLAGRTLKTQVEATDISGARQIERGYRDREPTSCASRRAAASAFAGFVISRAPRPRVAKLKDQRMRTRRRFWNPTR